MKQNKKRPYGILSFANFSLVVIIVSKFQNIKHLNDSQETQKRNTEKKK